MCNLKKIGLIALISMMMSGCDLEAFLEDILCGSNPTPVCYT